MEPVASAVVQNLTLPQTFPVSEVVPENFPEFDDDGIPVLPAIPFPSLIEFISNNRDVVSRYVFKRMGDAIHDNLDEIDLFKIKGLDMVVVLQKNDYGTVLETISDRFLKAEEYEMIPRCNKLLDKFHANRLMDESR